MIENYLKNIFDISIYFAILVLSLTLRGFMELGELIGGRFFVTSHFAERWKERSHVSKEYFDLIIKYNAYLRLCQDTGEKWHNLFFCSETKEYYVFIVKDKKLITFQTETIYNRMIHAVPISPNKDKLYQHLSSVKVLISKSSYYNARNWFTVSVHNGRTETKLSKFYWSDLCDYTDTIWIEFNLDKIVDEIWGWETFSQQFMKCVNNNPSSAMTYIVRAFDKEYHCNIEQPTEESD